MNKQDLFYFLVGCGEAGFEQSTVRARRQKKAAKIAKKKARRKRHKTQNLIIAHEVAKGINSLLK